MFLVRSSIDITYIYDSNEHIGYSSHGHIYDVTVAIHTVVCFS